MIEMNEVKNGNQIHQTKIIDKQRWKKKREETNEERKKKNIVLVEKLIKMGLIVEKERGTK